MMHATVRLIAHFFVVCSAMLGSANAWALGAGDWFGRIGASMVDPDSSSGTVPGFPGSGVEVDDDTQLSFTVGYMMTDNIGLEVLGALPFTHEIRGTGSIAGLGEIAETKHLPPVLSLQYHFMPQAAVRPYVGAGVNYTYFFDEETKGALAGTSIDLDDSWGLAGQVGVDIDIPNNWFVNLDGRYIDIDTEATLGGIGTVDVQIDPWVFTVALGRRF